jgi:hypothetical protein
MSQCRILYLRESILEDTAELTSDDLIEAARMASSTHPHLTAEIWWDGRKVAVIRPCWTHRLHR